MRLGRWALIRVRSLNAQTLLSALKRMLLVALVEHLIKISGVYHTLVLYQPFILTVLDVLEIRYQIPFAYSQLGPFHFCFYMASVGTHLIEKGSGSKNHSTVKIGGGRFKLVLLWLKSFHNDMFIYPLLDLGNQVGIILQKNDIDYAVILYTVFYD